MKKELKKEGRGKKNERKKRGCEETEERER